MANEREAALGALDLEILRGGKSGEEVAASRFVILLSKGSSTLAYRGLFVVHGDDGQNGGPQGGMLAGKLHGWGPKNLNAENSAISGFYKFDSSKRGFVDVSSRSFGGTVDAVCIDPSFLRKKR